jgi:hypothetical protein
VDHLSFVRHPRRSAAAGRGAGRWLLAVVIGAATARGVAAQAPGLPVLQSAFYVRGFAIGADAAGGNGTRTGAAALSYSPLTGTLIVVGGIGSVHAAGISETTTGFRVAYRFRTFGADRQIGAALFLGAGGAGTKKTTRVRSTPIGLSFAYRRALGETRALALYAAPYYDATRVTPPTGVAKTTSRFRAGLGADVAVTSSIGAGIGLDIGAAAPTNAPLLATTLFGGGLSYHF